MPAYCGYNGNLAEEISEATEIVMKYLIFGNIFSSFGTSALDKKYLKEKKNGI